MTDPQRIMPSLASCVAQFLADLSTLPESRQLELASALMEEGSTSPIEKLRVHLKERPGRVPHYAAIVLREMPFYQALRHLECFEGMHFFERHAQAIIDCLGDSRGYYVTAALMHIHLGERFGKEMFRPIDGPEVEPASMPSSEKISALDQKMAADLIPVESLQIRDAHKSMLAAQQRALRAEQELKDSQLKWSRTQERMTAEAQRSKVKAAEQAQGSAAKQALSELTVANEKLASEIKLHELTKEKLAAAEARLREIEDHGGATPEKVDDIRNELRREADQRIEDELSIAVRPWLAKMIEIENSRKSLEAGRSLCSQALARAKKEAESLDFVINWELDRERSLRALEQEVAELDALMIRVIKPTPELIKMHSDLLESMLLCRKQLNPTKPHGEVAKALIAGIKKVKDEDLGDAAYAVRKLAEKGVFLGLEAEALLKIVEGEKQLRYDKVHYKKSILGRLMQRLHSGDKADILIDGYNYMFTANQHFGDKLKLNRNADGDAVFGIAGRNKLNALLRPVIEKFSNLEVHVFYDGIVKEDRRPHPRLTLWEPTYQRKGKGQADAEIAHVGLKRIRTDAMAVVVTNDKVVQRYADHFLSVRLFSELIDTV